MKNRFLGYALVGACGIALLAVLATAQDKKQEPPKKPETGQKAAGQGAPAGQAGGQMDEAMKKAMELGQAGPENKKLEKLAGNWNFEMRWWKDPNGEPMTIKGTATYKALYDGRFLQQEVTSPPMMPGDTQPFHGMSLLGFDRVRKEYVSTWIDNMGTGIMISYGTADPSGKVITYKGEMSDPMSGNPAAKVREVVRLDSDDKHTFEMYSPGPDGKEVKAFDITYTRATK